MMKNLLALASVVALMTACAGMAGHPDGGPDGATIAAMLGYHGRIAPPGNDGN